MFTLLLFRFPRCYSESYKSRGPPLREELRNLDRIETIGEEPGQNRYHKVRNLDRIDTIM